MAATDEIYYLFNFIVYFHDSSYIWYIFIKVFMFTQNIDPRDKRDDKNLFTIIYLMDLNRVSEAS